MWNVSIVVPRVSIQAAASGSLDKYYWECISFVNVCRHIYQSVYFCKTFSAWWRLLAFIERALRYTYLIYTKLKGPWILFAKMPDNDNPSMCNRNVTRDLLNLCDKLYKIRSELSVLPIYYNCELRFGLIITHLFSYIYIKGIFTKRLCMYLRKLDPITGLLLIIL